MLLTMCKYNIQHNTVRKWRYVQCNHLTQRMDETYSWNSAYCDERSAVTYTQRATAQKSNYICNKRYITLWRFVAGAWRIAEHAAWTMSGIPTTTFLPDAGNLPWGVTVPHSTIRRCAFNFKSAILLLIVKNTRQQFKPTGSKHV